MYAMTLNPAYLAGLAQGIPTAAHFSFARLSPYMTQPITLALFPAPENVPIAGWQIARQLLESRQHNPELGAIAFREIRQSETWLVPPVLESFAGAAPGRLLLLTANLRRGLGDMVLFQPIFRAQAKSLAARGWPAAMSISTSSEFQVLFHQQQFLDLFLPEFPNLQQLLQFDAVLEYGMSLARMKSLIGIKTWEEIDLQITLHAPAVMQKKWRSLLQSTAPNIFINWASFDKHRTFSPQFFSGIREVAPGANFYTSLHLDPRPGEVFPGGPVNLASHGQSLADLLGMLANMDCVITTNTGIAHVAAGLGVPTIVLFFGRLQGWEEYWPFLHRQLYPSLIPIGLGRELATSPDDLRQQTLKKFEMALAR